MPVHFVAVNACVTGRGGGGGGGGGGFLAPDVSFGLEEKSQI